MSSPEEEYEEENEEEEEYVEEEEKETSSKFNAGNKAQRRKRLSDDGPEYTSIFNHAPFQDYTPGLVKQSLMDAIEGRDNVIISKPGQKSEEEEEQVDKSKKPYSDTKPAARARINKIRGGPKTFIHLKEVPSKVALEFKVEKPIQAAIRMGHLMHTNTIPLNNNPFMELLHSKLEADEAKVSRNSVRNREQAEKERMRQLVIKGMLEPPEDMPEMKWHPVARVNKMFKQLDQQAKTLKTSMPVHTKITPVEPYEFDGDKFFKNLHKNGTYYIPPEEIIAIEDELDLKIARAKLRSEIHAASKQKDQSVIEFLQKKDSEEAILKERDYREMKLNQLLASHDFEDDALPKKFAKKIRKLEVQQELLNEDKEDREKAQFERYSRNDPFGNKIDGNHYLEKYLKLEEAKRIEQDMEVDSNEYFAGDGRFTGQFRQPPTPEELEETESFIKIRKLFGARGNSYYYYFQPYESFAIEHFLKVAETVDGIMERGEMCADMFARQKMAGDDMMKDIEKQHYLHPEGEESHSTAPPKPKGESEDEEDDKKGTEDETEA